jgi:hypothetical protein
MVRKSHPSDWSAPLKGIKLGHDWIVRELKYRRKRRPKGWQKPGRNDLNCSTYYTPAETDMLTF